MKLSKDTLNLLKNFSSINPNILVTPGSTIQTVSEAKNIQASAAVSETFNTSFGIYDLKNFLAALALVPDADIELGDKSMTISEGRTSVQYFFADPTVLTTPSKEIKLPHVDAKFLLTEQILDSANRAAAVLGHSNLVITGDDGVIEISIADPKNSTANRYKIVVDDNNECKSKFSLVFAIGNIKIIPGDYEVSVAGNSKGLFISHFKNISQPVQYWISLETTSTFSK